MSLQRVFESARKMGIPVIVTDPAGREPMVVLPLEQFEAMAGGMGETRPEMPKKAPETPYFDNFPLNEAKKSQNMGTITSMSISEEIPLEDRFYIEPLDDGSGA